jgi:ribose transport system permease protein
MVSSGVPSVLAIVLGLLFSAVFGLVNGLLVVYGRLSSIIATLATGTLATGAGLALVGPNTISGLSPGFLNLFSSSVGGVQTAFYILVVLTAGAAVVLQRTLLGRRLFFVGQNRDSAALLGIKVRRLTIGSLVVASVLAGFAGIMLAGQNGGTNVTQTSGYLLPAFAAAFLGTAAIVPGRFNATGTLIAVYVLGTATVGLNMAGVATWSTYIFNGGLLILSLGLFTVLKLRKERQAKRESMAAFAKTEAGDE